MRNCFVTFSMILILGGLAGCPVSPRPLFSMEETGLDFVEPRGDSLNEMAWVAGGVEGVETEKGELGSMTPTVWIDGTLRSLAARNLIYGVAKGVNDDGFIVGQTLPSEAILWFSGNNQPLSLNSSLQGFDGLDTYSINRFGLITGMVVLNQAALFDSFSPESGLLLEPLAAGPSAAFDINERNEVVGSSATDDTGDVMAAVRWIDGLVAQLDSLGGDFSAAYAVNNQGTAAGVSTEPLAGRKGDDEGDDEEDVGPLSAVYWDGNGINALPGLGGENSVAWDINDKGQVVGFAQNENGERQAMLWRPMAVFGLFESINLNDVVNDQEAMDGLTLRDAVDINEKGVILCRAERVLDEEMSEDVYVLLRPQVRRR